MMLAQRVHFDVLHHHHLVIIDVEQRGPQNILRVLVVALSQKFHRLLDSFRCLQQSIACRIFVEALQQFPVDLLRGVTLQSARGPIMIGSCAVDSDIVNRLDRRSRVCFCTSLFSHALPPPHIQKSYSPSPRSGSGRALRAVVYRTADDEWPGRDSRLSAPTAQKADPYSGSSDGISRPQIHPPRHPDRPCLSPCPSLDPPVRAPKPRSDNYGHGRADYCTCHIHRGSPAGSKPRSPADGMR